MEQALIDVNDLRVFFPVQNQLIRPEGLKGRLQVRAVDGLSFQVKRGELLALVGESGCGKTTVAKTLVGLQEPSHGRINYAFGDIGAQTGSRRKRPQVREYIQYIFQDPYSSLNPRMTIRTILERPMICFKRHPEDRGARIRELVQLVGLSETHLDRYPHEFSGGQKQRISIARALAADPICLVADEPTAALDVSIQGQILNLLMALKDRLKLTILLVTHDLGIVRQLSDRVIVMYLGRIMETGKSQDLFENPLHPYTQSLLGAMPAGPGGQDKDRVRLSGSIPSPINPPPGCRLHERCPFAMPICQTEEPFLRRLPGDRTVSCHLITG